MDIKDLEIFYTVARTGSMTRAAKQLGFVQSHITGRIRLVENELNRPLFERLKTGVVLTAEGKKLYPYAESLLVQWNETRRVFSEQGELFGSLRIGSLETTAALHTAGWIAKFHKENPNIEISLQTGTTRDLLRGVVDRTLDIALVAGTVEHVELDSKALVSEELAILTAHGSTLDNMLIDQPVVITFREGCTYRRILERWLADRGVALYKTMESASIDTILQLTAGGLGISLMPKSIVMQSSLREKVTVHPVDPYFQFVTTHAVWRHGQHVVPTVSKFLEQLCDEY
ncbi:LysR family transcriptional regulator [Alicyclobacillus fastidiosus]|uniref:LysR substrate-binding domain-containing protein n=1 Tax=Alicyclobacillus fastidiosus TaxID=392011 RepID=A0ABV5A9X8_9BACL|nr:LysR substrate-binding domain-containing protein [Alicyclobacillus fastidiosus]WEH07760.1 LysR substrate-binding domain-containing protein [Alicyclobacillus fastidiosus]